MARAPSTELTPLITPPPALGPPIIGTDTAGSAPGVPQPHIVSGGQSLPPSFPLGSAGTWMPPPLVGSGGNAPFSKPVVPPGSGVSQNQPQFKTGSATSPTAASLFPSFSAAGPFQPIVLTTHMQIGLGPPPFTTGSQPIAISSVATIPQFPWVDNTPEVPNPLNYHVVAPHEPDEPDDPEPLAAAHEALADYHEERAAHHEKRAAHHTTKAKKKR